jgi:hypothetical protein
MISVDIVQAAATGTAADLAVLLRGTGLDPQDLSRRIAAAAMVLEVEAPHRSIRLLRVCPHPVVDDGECAGCGSGVAP